MSDVWVGQPRKKLILCFDGTGNKFKGNSGDTNILKIFRMLDRSSGNQCKDSIQFCSLSFRSVRVSQRLTAVVPPASSSLLSTYVPLWSLGAY